jgi:HD-GYP domain-containing protein (c-di-GMP phosphodiesterase class II)
MTSDRPYRQAISHAEALRELSAHSGRQFDPDVVAAFAQIKPVAVPTAEPMRATAVEPRE